MIEHTRVDRFLAKASEFLSYRNGGSELADALADIIEASFDILVDIEEDRYGHIFLSRKKAQGVDDGPSIV